MKGLKAALKKIKKDSPLENLLPFLGEEVEVKITGKDLYSEINSILPSPDIIDYLLDISTNVDISRKLKIVVDDEVDLEKAKKTYCNYLSLLARRASREVRVFTFKIIGFLFFGAVVLTLSYFLEERMQRVIYDSVNIIGGFSIWEAADLFFFGRWEKRKELKSIIRLINAPWTQRNLD